ncbi:hypothetical protein JRQ81_000055, partial [Phrynocephalus forsythii]
MIAMKEETSLDREPEEEGILSSFQATHVLQPVSLVEGSGWRSWKEGPGRERGDWEAQWQDYLRTLQPPGPGGEPSGMEETSVAPWEDARAFLASFEQVAQAFRWPRGEWAARLVPALSGAAEEAFQGLDATHRGDYGKGPATDDLLGALEAAEHLLEGDQNGAIEMGGGIKCPSQTSSLLPLQGQGTDQTRADEGQSNLKETGPSLQVVQQSGTEPGRETMVRQVLQEREEEKNEDPLGIGMGSQIKMETSQGEGNRMEDPTRATPRIIRKNGQKTLEEGSRSREKLGDQPLETEEAPPTGLTGGLSASVHQSSSVRTSDKRPLVSRYGRKYHYLHELDIADSTEDHVESQTSEENLPQRSSCDKKDRKLTGERKLESSENSLEGKQRNHLEEKSHNSPEHGNRLSCAKSLERNQGIQSEEILHG